VLRAAELSPADGRRLVATLRACIEALTRGFRNIRAKAAQPASVPKPGKLGPGRPPGSRNRRPAPRHDVGKTTKRELTLKAKRERTGKRQA
jgi:hypothetical protein